MLKDLLRRFTSKSCLLLIVAGSAAIASAAPEPGAAENLATLPGFAVERVAKAEKGVNGSWISLGKDAKGRLLLSGQNRQPMTRITLKDGKVEKQEVMKLPISEIMGVLAANDSLYVNGSNGRVFGLFRLRDTKGNDQYDSVELLREWHGGAGEHGAHGIVLGADKKLYVVCGNFVDVPSDLAPASPHRNYADDRVLPRSEDGNGFGAGKKPPGGFIVRLDADGKNAELFASGQRNTYDIAFNPDGEVFGFDSDMEYDWGTPWYRPIRVFQGVSGGDTGFREGTAKWPEYYADSIPAAVNIGIGCPTGVAFGTGSKFPAKYQKAFYILDWTYGRLIAVHLTPKGAGYTGTWENFIAPKSLNTNDAKTPNNLTDVVIGDDGAMYFTVGGRDTAAGLYRVTYTGSESTAAADLHDADGADARALRHKLETFHGRQDAAAVETAWPQMGSEDRYIRYAARIAIEAQPVEQWRDKALAETKPEAALTALLALARVGGKDAQPDVLKALARMPIASLTETQQLEKLRAIEVSICRQGTPSPEAARQIMGELDPMFPAKSTPMNLEMSQVLLSLQAPDAVTKTVALLAATPLQEEQLAYVLYLRTAVAGWTPEARKAYFTWWTQDHSKAQHWPEEVKWFEDAGRPYSDGASYPRFLSHFHADAETTLQPKEVTALAPVLAAYRSPDNKPKPMTRARELVKAWQLSDLAPALDKVAKGRNFERGKEVFATAQCIACHRFGNEGGAVGPDLTAVSSRYTAKDILESIIEPSKVVSEQFQNTTIRTKDGDVLDGRILEDNKENVVLQPNALLPDRVTVKKANIDVRQASKLSPMPEGLVNTFTQDEILDLIAYLSSGGRNNAPAFSK